MSLSIRVVVPFVYNGAHQPEGTIISMPDLEAHSYVGRGSAVFDPAITPDDQSSRYVLADGTPQTLTPAARRQALANLGGEAE
jgi:hypothetical protein